MATEAQIAANRENAKKSTGPKTPEGKVKSAQNALKHGFRANIILKYAASVEDERPDGFASLLLDLVARLQPDGPLEEFCVETVATCMWRLRRVVGEENNLIDELHADLENDRDEQELYRAPDSPEPSPLVYPFLPKSETLLPLIRYESHLNRQRHAAMHELRELQALRLNTPRRFAWPPLGPAPFPASPTAPPIPSSAQPPAAAPSGAVPGEPAGHLTKETPNEPNPDSVPLAAPTVAPPPPLELSATLPAGSPCSVPNEPSSHRTGPVSTAPASGPDQSIPKNGESSLDGRCAAKRSQSDFAPSGHAIRRAGQLRAKH